MEVLWICGSRVLGGAERVTLCLSGLLRARGHHVEALCRADGPVRGALGAAGLVTHSAPLGGALNVRAVVAIGRALAERSPDVALVTTSSEWVTSCLATFHHQRARLVLVRHMALPLAWPVRWLADRRAAAVVAVSHAVRRSLLWRAGIAPHRLHVIPNPVRFAPRTAVPDARDRMHAREVLGLEPAGYWVAFFGGLKQAKGLRDVLSVVRRANDRVGPTNLLVCGYRPVATPTPSVADLAREFALDARVHDLGETEHVEKAMVAADVVVMATHRELSEALPATLTEAMACGTPVVGYATGGVEEVIGVDGRAGSLARPDDIEDLARAVVELLADPARARRQAAAALARTRELFDPQRVADQYEQLFARL